MGKYHQHVNIFYFVIIFFLHFHFGFPVVTSVLWGKSRRSLRRRAAAVYKYWFLSINTLSSRDNIKMKTMHQHPFHRPLNKHRVWTVHCFTSKPWLTTITTTIATTGLPLDAAHLWRLLEITEASALAAGSADWVFLPWMSAYVNICGVVVNVRHNPPPPRSNILELDNAASALFVFGFWKTLNCFDRHPYIKPESNLYNLKTNTWILLQLFSKFYCFFPQ